VTLPRPPAADRRAYELLIFDWDGTLMDSLGGIVACTRATLAELGLPQLPEAQIRGAVGLSIAETVRRLAGGDAEPGIGASIRDTYRRLWLSTYGERGVLFAGVGELLDELEGAGYLLAVATGKGRAGLDRDLAATGLAGRFVATRTADEAHSKPHPQMVLDLLDELGATPRRSLVVGDSLWDLQMAAAAATPAVAVATGAHPRAELLAATPAPLACLAAIRDLAPWLRAAARGDGFTGS
jgi:phosphoglycolate phosphatase